MEPAAPDAAAAAAGLRYVTDDRPGIRRIRRGRGFSYRTPDGRRLEDAATLARIRRLAVPPAWTDVWICPREDGHLQATGRDDRGRKQYRYHAAFRARRDRDKFARTERFARALPRIRRRVEHDLEERGLTRERVLAATVRLLERALIRVGSEAYARENRSFGVATLRDRHASVDGPEVRLRFRGKAGRVHDVTFRDRRLARIIGRCRDLPGQELFQWLDEDGEVRDVRSDDINAYIREAAGSDEFSAKDFRTWAGTVLAFRALAATGLGLDPEAASKGALAQGVRFAVAAAAERLGNTPAVARSAYVHPRVIEAYLDDGVREAILRAADVDPSLPLPPTPAEERAVLALLREQARHERASRPTGRRASAARRPRSRGAARPGAPARVASPRPAVSRGRTAAAAR